MAKRPIPQINVPIMKQNGSMELAWYLFLQWVAENAIIDDKDVVHIKGKETIFGEKTVDNAFSVVTRGEENHYINQVNDDVIKGETPPRVSYWAVCFNDKKNTGNADGWKDTRLGALVGTLTTGNVMTMSMRAYKNEADSSVNTAISISYNTSNNTVYTYAPTPIATDSKSGNYIATTGWVNDYQLSTNIVHREGTETIVGNKIFKGGTLCFRRSADDTYEGFLYKLSGGALALGMQNSDNSSWQNFIQFNTDGSGALSPKSGQYFTTNTPATSNSTSDIYIATTGWVNDATKSTNVVHRTDAETIDGVKTFNSEIKGRWRTASCHTTNNFSTQQWFKLGQFKSYNTYNTHSFVFKLWIGTNDFPGVASGRVITRSGGGGTAGTAQYARVQFNHSLEWLTLSNFKILYKENQTDANGTYVLFELWAHTLGNYTGYTMSIEDERAGGEVYDTKWEFYNLPTGVASLPSGYSQIDAILARNFALDSDVVHTSGAETINDIKTFSSPINGKIDTSISSNYGSPFRTRFTLLANNYDTPSTNYSIQNCDCLANDYSYIAWAAEGRDTSGASFFTLSARNRASSSGSNRSASMGIYVDSSGNGFGYAPNTDRNSSILTTVNKSKGTNGYFKLGNGMIVQWGRASGTIGNTITVNFPTAFSGDYSFSVTTAAISGSATVQSQVAATASSYFKVILANSNILWVAIGY